MRNEHHILTALTSLVHKFSIFGKNKLSIISITAIRPKNKFSRILNWCNIQLVHNQRSYAPQLLTPALCRLIRIIIISNVVIGSFISCKQIEKKESISVINLTCELLENPVGIDSKNPLLSWIIQSNQRNIQQTAYHILVASSPELLDKDLGDMWNTGKVESNQSVYINYAGENLKSRMQCFWKVKIWTKNGVSTWSKPASWSMGLLHYKDWQGRWIGFDKAFPWDKVEKFSKLSARYFRKEFESDTTKEIKRATVYIMGLGLYELYMNGKKVGDQVLSPGPTDYTKNVKYNTIDVTNYLRDGKNAIGTILGNGRYFTMRQNYKPYKIKTFGFPKMMLNLIIDYTDGSQQVIRTDNSWKGTADGPIRSNNEYDGEFYDARKEMPGWNLPDYDDSEWLKAEYVQEPCGEFEAQMNPNMKIMKVIKPVSISKLGNNRYILDMGQNMAGWLRIRVKGNRGDKVVLRFAESLLPSGELLLAPLRDAKVTDTYILKGSITETWEPNFVYHGFRYVEISGYPGTPVADNFEGCVIYDDMNDIGSFESSNQLLNQIYHNAYWSVISNYKGMPIDCPQRNERMPWLGDRAIGCYGESFIVDNSKLYIKWLDDIRNTQRTDGCISDVAPSYFRYYSDNMTWPGTYLFVADMLYDQYGLSDPIRDHYTSMKKWLYYMKDRYLADNILTKDSYGDWCEPPKTIEEGRGKSANVKHPSELISTAYFYHYLQLMQKFARISRKQNDITSYKILADSVRNAFNNKFFHTNGAYYGNKKLTENLLAVSFNLVQEQYKNQVLQTIEDIILIDNNAHLSVGLVGAQWLMRCLSENGMEELAYKLATNTTYPSWGYMVENGATTIWELWNANTAAPNMNSQNHVMMLGDLIIWYYEDLAGIKSAPQNPGFKKIIMKPDFPEELDFVKAKYQSPYGEIISYRTRNKTSLEWNITIPANANAVVYLPTTSGNNVTENNMILKDVNGINKISQESDKLILNLGSGTYNFKIDNIKATQN